MFGMSMTARTPQPYSGVNPESVPPQIGLCERLRSHCGKFSLPTCNLTCNKEKIVDALPKIAAIIGVILFIVVIALAAQQEMTLPQRKAAVLCTMLGTMFFLGGVIVLCHRSCCAKTL